MNDKLHLLHQKIKECTNTPFDRTRFMHIENYNKYYYCILNFEKNYNNLCSYYNDDE